MNLTKYFLENFDGDKYPYYNRMIKSYGIDTLKNYPCEYIDDEEIINKWKSLTYPGKYDNEMRLEFLLLSFYLINEGYEIEEHPTLLLKILPLDVVSEKTLKDSTRTKIGTKNNGAVAWGSRRDYSDSLTFVKKNTTIPHSTNINDIFKLVSPNNNEFNNMTLDEKLAQIRNVFSYIGKDEKGKYIDLEIDKISKDYVTKQQLQKYQNELQCFRHGEKDMVEKRNEYTDEQKMFLIDFGLSIINATERYLNSK